MTKLETLQHKILSTKEVIQLVNRWRLHGYKIAFTNGCFDLLHKGHIKVLTGAAQTANKLIVALNTDKSVVKLKGTDRPIHTEQDRAIVLAALQFVDAVVLFDEDTPQELISLLLPDVLVKGGDYEADAIVGATTVVNNGGTVVVIPTEMGYATTKIIDKIKKKLASYPRK
jgi:rfaE bifunctional protein nucleotidyltransferase chain/domain